MMDAELGAESQPPRIVFHAPSVPTERPGPMRLLVVVRDPKAREALTSALRALGCEVVVGSAPSLAAGRDPFSRLDAAILDYRPRSQNLGPLAARLRGSRPELPLIAVVDSATAPTAAKALRVRPETLLTPPFRASRLKTVLTKLRAGPVPPEPVVGPRREAAWDHRTGVVALGATLPLELGEARVESERTLSEHASGRDENILRLDVTDAPPNLLARLLVGSYITGQDQVLVSAVGGVTRAQLDELHSIANRMLGMTVVDEGPHGVEVEILVDPTRYELPRLLDRVVQLLRAEVAACRAALTEGSARPLASLRPTEEEVDRLYLLMVRQLLLSSDSPRTARSVAVESHHYQLGYRLVAKELEVIGDLLEGIGDEIARGFARSRSFSRPTTAALQGLLRELERDLLGTMRAFARLSVREANALLNRLSRTIPWASDLGDTLARRCTGRQPIIAAERIVLRAAMVLEMLVVINEVTINRSVEPETVARRGTGGMTGGPSRRALGPAR